MMQFTVKHTTQPISSIWSEDYVPNSLIPLKEAALTYLDGGQAGFVSWMKDRCSITQDESLRHHLGVDDVWRKLQNAFVILSPVIYYEPIMRSFLRELFRTLKEDKISWVEARTVFITPFLLAGQESPATTRSMDLARILVEEIEGFKASEEGKGFWGCRFIWTSMRGGTTAQIVEGELHPQNNRTF
jgi:adenosine deaminase CECR1